MRRMALITNKKVENIIMVDDQFKPPKGVIAIETDTANISDTHDGTNFIRAKAQLSKAELIIQARLYRINAINAGVKFESDEVVSIPAAADICSEVAALVWVANFDDADVTLIISNKISDKILKLDKEQITKIHESLMHHIANCSDLLGKTIKGILDGSVASIEEIDDLWRALYVQ